MRLILLEVQITTLFRQQCSELNDVCVFAITAREGESRLHKFDLGNLTLFIMVKIVDFFFFFTNMENMSQNQ